MPSISGTTISLDGIGHLLSDNQLQVPVYQRSFSWTEEEIKELLSDLWDSFRRGDEEYFLGSIVITGGANGQPLVVDGQQRLATVCMLCAGIRDILQSNQDKRAEPFAQKYLYSLNLRTEETDPKLRLNEVDDDFFRKAVLITPSLSGQVATPSTDSHRRIKQGFQRVGDWLKQQAKANTTSLVSTLIDFAEFVEKKAKVIVVRVPDEANAFVIFETLNDRGLELSIADLLKNYVFGRSENRIDEARTNWLRATSALEGAGGDKRIATFIRHFWSSKNGPVRERELYGDLKKSIRTKQAAIDFSTELSENARLYAAILNSDHDFWAPLGSDARQHVQTLVNLRLEQYRPLLLACMSEFSPTELKRSLRLVVSWNVRLLVVGGLGGGTMERYYAEGGSKVRKKELQSATDLAKYAAKFVPTDSQFEASFAAATVSQAFLVRYYLQALEQSLRGEQNPELVPNTLEKEVNLEHVLPQNANLKEWPLFDEESAPANVKRIGNLTLLKSDENLAAGNKPFSTKKNAFKRSQLKLNEGLATENSWAPDRIAARQSMLAKIAVQTWPLKP